MAVVNDKINTINNNNLSPTNLKICGVCGDKALGYNFNAVTCESCKAFFRRNALTTKEFRCPFNGNCEITVLKRRFCQKCRLEKCFAIGMRKEYIMSEEDKELKRKKIEQNRAKKRTSSCKLLHEDNTKRIKQETNSASDESCDGYRKVTNDTITLTKFNKINNSAMSPNCNVILTNCTSDITIVNSKNEYLLNENRFNDTNHISYTSNNVEISNGSAISVPYQIVEVQSDNSNSTSIVNETNDATMMRTMLNPTPTSNDTSILTELIGNDMQCRNQNSHKLSHRNSVNMIDVTRDVMQDVQRIPIEPNSIESILCEAIKLEFEAYTAIAPPHTSNSRELNDAERAKLNELIVANKALLHPVDDDVTYIAEDGSFMPAPLGAAQPPELLDVINLTAIAIRRLIKMAKKISAFKNMCQEDQVALLKGGCTEMMILRSAMSYDQSRESWKIPHSQESKSRIKVDVLKQAKGNIYQEHERFIKTFDPKWRMDENIILIMSAITLFTPDRPRVIHQDVIKLEQNSYYYLLRRYLESIYQGCEAKSTFLKLIQKISELHKLNGEVISVYLDVNPSDVEPLLIELFDLKPH